MRLFEKIFCNTRISWKFLILYSVVTAVVIGLLNCIPFLEDTSFVYPAVTLEYWFVAAMFVIFNCRSAKEAAVKTFVFFLVSQPLIYLVEVPFKADGWGLFRYYPYWGKATLLTLPGAWIAYQVKRDNVLSAVILSVATGFLFVTGVSFAKRQLTEFPNGLLAMIFCFAFGIIFIQLLLKKVKTRAIAYICSIVLAVGALVFIGGGSHSYSAGIDLEQGHQWEIKETDIVADIVDGYLTVSGTTKGTYSIIVQDDEGETKEYEVLIEERTMHISEK